MTKNTWYVIIVVAVVAFLGLGWWWMQNSSTPATNQTANTENTLYQTSPTTQETDTTTSTGKISYQNALKLYGDRRIQFDQKCQLTPNNVTFKKGTTIMLDNRSNKRTVISLDNANYSIGAYSYIAVTLTTAAALPHTVSVDCGKGENNGVILLQK